MPIRRASKKERILRGLTLCCVVILLFSTVTPVQASSSSKKSDVQGGDIYRQATASNNSTTLHENPQKADDKGNSEQLQSHLAQYLSQRLGQSAIHLNQSEYQQANQTLGSDYSDALAKYIEVAGETGGGNEQTVQEFKRAQKRQQKYANLTQEYRQTYKEYQEARENGNSQRARELARELNDLSREINKTGGKLRKSFNNIENGSDTNLSQPSQTVEDIQQNISEQQEDVVEAEFIETEITASTEREQASFSEGAYITGALQTENGTPIADREVTIRVGNKTINTTTADDGYFGVGYRPTTVPATATNVTVEYIPDNDSQYLNSNTTIPLEIQRVNGTLEITRMPEQTAYNETVSITGLLTVDGVPASDAPVKVTLGGVTLGTATTNSAGGFLVQTQVPASVPSGQQPLQLEMANTGAALGAESTSQSVQVTPTSTTITTTANHTGGRTVDVSGQFTTADGVPLPNQSIIVQGPGSSQQTVKTDVNGTYQASLAIAQSDVPENGTVSIVAIYPGRGSNLERTQARDTVTLPVPNETKQSWLPFDWRYLLVGGGVLVLSLLGAWLLLRDSSDSSLTHAPSSSRQGGTNQGHGPTATSLLTSARERLQHGNTDDAVRSAYAAVRQWGADVYDIADIRTHWEFYQASRERGSPEEAESLERLTESYERAAFDRQQTDEAEADSAVKTAGGLIDSDESN